MQRIYLGYIYSKFRKIRVSDKDDSVKIQVKYNHHSKSLRRRSNEDDKYFTIEVSELPHY